MNRRQFVSTVGGAALTASALSAREQHDEPRDTEAAKPETPESARSSASTWLPLDFWHVEHQDNVELRQGRPQWVPEATYEDPGFDYLASWPTVWKDARLGCWLMVYPITGGPMTLMAAASDDGVAWRPFARPDIEPEGEKLAPHHVFSAPVPNGGPVYRDPVAADGRPFKIYCSGEPGRIGTSVDGLHWRLEPGAQWTFPGWRPDPPMACFYNARRKLHTMMTRPGHGDRRIVRITSPDAIQWSRPELILQPDPLDEPQVQFYGMPVVPYEGRYIGMLWTARFSNADPLRRYNQLVGPVDSQLTYSADGIRFQRGLRETFIPLNEPGAPGGGLVNPACVVEHDDRLRIYCSSTTDMHVQYSEHLPRSQWLTKGRAPASAILLYTLRKDGFMYLASRGNWANLTTKPLALFAPELRLNVLAPYGELAFQITDLLSKPIPGYTFADCVPLKEVDSLDAPLSFRDKADLSDLTNRPIRLQMKFRGARVHAMRGQFHWLDALDVALLNDSKPIDRTFFDY